MHHHDPGAHDSAPSVCTPVAAAADGPIAVDLRRRSGCRAGLRAPARRAGCVTVPMPPRTIIQVPSDAGQPAHVVDEEVLPGARRVPASRSGPDNPSVTAYIALTQFAREPEAVEVVASPTRGTARRTPARSAGRTYRSAVSSMRAAAPPARSARRPRAAARSRPASAWSARQSASEKNSTNCRQRRLGRSRTAGSRPSGGGQEVVRVAAEQRQLEPERRASAPAASARAGRPRSRRQARRLPERASRSGRRRRRRPARSSTATDSPARASSVAATSPLWPAPTTTTSRCASAPRSCHRSAEPADELQPRPGRVHRAHLDVHQPDREPVRADHVLVQVGRDPAARFGQAIHERAGRGQPRQLGGEPAAQRRPVRAERQHHVVRLAARAGADHRPGRRGQVEAVRRADQQHPAARPDRRACGQRLAG